MPQTYAMDIISRHFIEAESLPYVDTRAIMEIFAPDLAAGCCSDVRHSGGAHVGAISKFYSESSRLTVSSLVIQAALGQLCALPAPAPAPAALMPLRRLSRFRA